MEWRFTSRHLPRFSAASRVVRDDITSQDETSACSAARPVPHRPKAERLVSAAGGVTAGRHADCAAQQPSASRTVRPALWLQCGKQDWHNSSPRKRSWTFSFVRRAVSASPFLPCWLTGAVGLSHHPHWAGAAHHAPAAQSALCGVLMLRALPSRNAEAAGEEACHLSGAAHDKPGQKAKQAASHLRAPLPPVVEVSQPPVLTDLGKKLAGF